MQESQVPESEERHGNRLDGRGKARKLKGREAAPERAAVGQSGEEGKGRNGRLSSQNRKRSRRKKADWKGKARRREQKGSTSGTAVGAKLGGTKGNKQKAEYEEPGKKT